VHLFLSPKKDSSTTNKIDSYSGIQDRKLESLAAPVLPGPAENAIVIV